MEVRKKEIEELQSQAQALSQEGKSTDEVDSKRLTVQTKFMELLEPLNERKHNLLASKEIHQFNRDVEDEIVSRPSQHEWLFRKPPLLEPCSRCSDGLTVGHVGELSCPSPCYVDAGGSFLSYTKRNSTFLSGFLKMFWCFNPPRTLISKINKKRGLAVSPTSRMG